MEERRRFLRFKILLKGESETERGFFPGLQIVDFSREGLRILVPQKDFLKTEALKLNVYLPDKGLSVTILGRVRWIQQERQGYQIGAKIDTMEASSKNEILDYAYKIWREKKA